MHKLFLVTILLWLGIQTMFAQTQDTVVVSIPSLQNKMDIQNLQLQLADDEISVANADVLQTRAFYLPNITISHNSINTNSPLMAFGTKLNQEIVTQADFNPALLNDPDDIFNFSPKGEIQQPILNLDGKHYKRAAQIKVNALKLKKERTKEYLDMELAKAYLQLQLAHKAVDVLENAQTTVLANQKMINDYFEEGMIQKSDVLYMNVRVNELESHLQEANSNVLNASNFIQFLVNDEYSDVVLQPEEELKMNTLEENTTAQLNLDRTDILAYEKSVDAYEEMVKANKAKFLPRLNAFGAYEFNDDKIHEFDANNYLVGLQASWNIFDGKKSDSEIQRYKAEISKTQTELEKHKKQSQLELYTAYRKIKNAEKKVSLAKLDWEQTQEAYRIRKNRFEEGLEKSTDLLAAETQMSQKEFDYYQAIYEYNLAVEQFTFLKK